MQLFVLVYISRPSMDIATTNFGLFVRFSEIKNDDTCGWKFTSSESKQVYSWKFNSSIALLLKATSIGE